MIARNGFIVEFKGAGSVKGSVQFVSPILLTNRGISRL